MDWCENNGITTIFGLAGNQRLDALAAAVADDLKVRRAEQGAEKLRAIAEIHDAAKFWSQQRKVIARLEATIRGFAARYVVTSLPGDARPLYEDVCCVRGHAENLIKMHNSQLTSDRGSWRSPVANQVRFVLHTAAYWLLLARRQPVQRLGSSSAFSCNAFFTFVWFFNWLVGSLGPWD